ncbi:MAG: WD40 repeat domain-containing protein [Gemmataceae bacterium]
MRALAIVLLPLGLVLASGFSGRGGLEAIAVSSDGKQLAVGGQNRVVYLVDADKLTVQSRLWLGVRIQALAFSKDGSHLAVSDETNRIQTLSLATGKAVASRKQAGGFQVYPPGDLIAVRDLMDNLRHNLVILELPTFKEVQRIDVPERPIAWAFDADGKNLLILGASKLGEEKAISADEVPRDLRGLARWTFRQKNDGLESTLYTAEVATGKLGPSINTWYTSDSDSTQLLRAGSTIYVFNRFNQCARIGSKGETVMFETAQGTNHALGFSPDAKLLLTGGMDGGSVSMLEGDRRQLFRLDEQPGQAEYVNRFALRQEGPIWAVTSGFRLVRISRGARVEQVVPVY